MVRVEREERGGGTENMNELKEERKKFQGTHEVNFFFYTNV